MKTIPTFIALALLSICITATPNILQAQSTYYVSSKTGNNGNNGTKESPYKNLQKALDVAADGATIYVAEGNYYGMLNSGNINITKPVTIYGGYSTDFSQRDVLKYLSMIQPTDAANATTMSVGGTMQIKVITPNTEVVLDGLIFDRGNSIAYNPRGEGKPEGVVSPMMQPIGAKGIGGPELKTPEVLTMQTRQIYLDNPRCNLSIRNCAFINAPYYAIAGNFGGKKAIITNNIFINCRMAACEIPGGGIANEVFGVKSDGVFAGAVLLPNLKFNARGFGVGA
jgi:hypothetical protein